MRELMDLAAKFGRNWELVYEYVDCFRQAEWGCVRLKRRVALTKDVWRLFERNEFECQGKRYRTDVSGILEAMTLIVNSAKFGFKNHNYLKKVLSAKDAEKVSAQGMTAGEERTREQARTSGKELKTESPEPERMTAGQLKAREGVDSLAELVGKKME